MTTARTQRRDGEATRERLVRAALELYGASSFLGTTTPMLAERAGVAEGTIYRHFTSKEHLLNEAYRRAQRWAIGMLESVDSDRVRRAPERLALLARTITDTAAAEPALIRMLLSSAHEPFLDEQSRGLRRQVVDGLVQLVAMGKSDGQIRPGPAELWASVWLAIVGYAAERVAAGEWTADSAPMGLALEAAWDAIASREVASASRPQGEVPRPAPAAPES
jgi:TetR/AcrR family transcriptional regulator, multidrug resistance operon repressor